MFNLKNAKKKKNSILQYLFLFKKNLFKYSNKNIDGVTELALSGCLLWLRLCGKNRRAEWKAGKRASAAYSSRSSSRCGAHANLSAPIEKPLICVCTGPSGFAPWEQRQPRARQNCPEKLLRLWPNRTFLVSTEQEIYQFHLGTNCATPLHLRAF